MSIQREFLDWNQPLLPAAADSLIKRFGKHGNTIDCRRAVLVLPGSEAGRRLQQLMLERAEQTGKIYLPPTVTTESHLPEQLYKPRHPAASDFTQLFVWAQVLREASAKEHADHARLTVIVPNPPAAEAMARWLDLARLLKKQHEDLAREGLDFSHVTNCQVVRELPEELARWQAMLLFQQRYLTRIDALGFWDRQTARLKAIEYEECETDDEIILIGTVDLLHVLREMLDQVARKSPAQVTALIHAPASLAERFDSHGCAITSAWLEAELPFEEHQILRVGGANEQAAAVARELSWFAGRYRADQITIGLPDETLAPSIDRKLRQHKLKTRFVGGHTLERSGPVQLLMAVAGYLAQRDYPSFAALVRHPDVYAWLEAGRASGSAAGDDQMASGEVGAGRGERGEGSSPGSGEHASGSPTESGVTESHARKATPTSSTASNQSNSTESPLPSPLSPLPSPADESTTSTPSSTPSRDLLTALDKYYADRLPSDFDLSRVEIVDSYQVARLCRRLKDLLQPLLSAAGPIAGWITPLRELVSRVYAKAQLQTDNPADRPTRDAFKHLAQALESLESVPAEVAPQLSASDTIALLLDRLRGHTVPPPRDASAIEMLGWLELPQDDAPALLVTTYNEGRVPSYVDADLFLPEPIRRELGVGDNDRRYARDAYATSVLLHAREQVKFIVARHNVAGDPLAPSRLLFAADRETIARRALRIFSEESESLPPSLPPVPLPAKTMLPVPLAEPPTEPREEFSVSSFKSYLACPYRFYLQHVLRLKELADTAQELEPHTFGTLLHDCLDAFGREESIRSSQDPEQIIAFLKDQLDQKVEQTFSSTTRGAIAVQVEQLRTRLKRFANWQADHAREGWRIEHAEEEVLAPWEVDGRELTLKGRVDRIDIHQATGQAMVIDYKSGDSARDPERAHRRQKTEWIDLQLPLYRHLAQASGIEGEVRLGYIVLPKDVSKIGLLPAHWSQAELAEADETAREVIRSVWAGRFEPVSQEIDPRWDTFAAICQSRALGQRPVAEVEEQEA